MKKFLTLFFTQAIMVFICVNATSAACIQAEIVNIEKNLNNFRNLIVNFLEESLTNHIIKSGKIYIRRPNVMRISYEKPENVSVFIDKNIITYYDFQLDEATKIKHDPKYLSFLAKEVISFKNDFDSFKCERNGEEINVQVSIKNDDFEEINLQLYFSQYILNRIMIKNNQGQFIIKLSDMRFDTTIQDSEIKFRDKNFFNIN